MQLCRRCEEAELVSLERIIAALFQCNGGLAASTPTSAPAPDSASTKDMSLLLGPGAAKSVVLALWGKVQPPSAAAAMESVAATGDSTATAAPTAVSAAAGKATDLCAALRVIAMIAQLSPSVLSPPKIRMLVRVGLGPEVFAARDFGTMRATCLCLMCAPGFIQLPVATAATETTQQQPAKVAGKAKRGTAATAAAMMQLSAIETHSQAEALEEQRELQAALLSSAPMLRDILLAAFCEDNELLSRFVRGSFASNSYFSLVLERRILTFPRPSPPLVSLYFPPNFSFTFPFILQRMVWSM